MTAKLLKTLREAQDQANAARTELLDAFIAYEQRRTAAQQQLDAALTNLAMAIAVVEIHENP